MQERDSECKPPRRRAWRFAGWPAENARVRTRAFGSIQAKRSQLIGLAVPRLEVVQRVVDGIVGNVAIATPAGKDGSSGGWCELRQLLPRSSPSRDALSECAVGLRRLTRGFFVVRVHDDSP